jgi:hypothetical protein
MEALGRLREKALNRFDETSASEFWIPLKKLSDPGKVKEPKY